MYKYKEPVIRRVMLFVEYLRFKRIIAVMVRIPFYAEPSHAMSWKAATSALIVSGKLSGYMVPDRIIR